MFENLGTKLKSARINSDLSRKQIADMLNISVSTVGLYENGKRLPSLPVLYGFAVHYKVSVDYLLDLDTDSDNTMSLDGLSSKKKQVLKNVFDCFLNK